MNSFSSNEIISYCLASFFPFFTNKRIGQNTLQTITQAGRNEKENLFFFLKMAIEESLQNLINIFHMFLLDSSGIADDGLVPWASPNTCFSKKIRTRI